jgi:hypothetical protein
MTLVDVLADWLRPDRSFGFLLALPFFVAAAASLADWAESRVTRLARAESEDAALDSEAIGHHATDERRQDLQHSKFSDN